MYHAAQTLAERGWKFLFGTPFGCRSVVTVSCFLSPALCENSVRCVRLPSDTYREQYTAFAMLGVNSKGTRHHEPGKRSRGWRPERERGKSHLLPTNKICGIFQPTRISYSTRGQISKCTTKLGLRAAPTPTLLPEGGGSRPSVAHSRRYGSMEVVGAGRFWSGYWP